MSWSKGSEQGNGQTKEAPRSGKKAESRFHNRFKIQCRVTLSWEDAAGRTCSMRVRGVDMSRLGARVESSEPMVPGAFVFLQAPELKLMGGAVVKHCVRRGFSYRIGLEFRNPLTKCF
jgi:hypothetical protein